MVFRGKPSAGCENCRKAKKRCGLEQPACLRCVKLKKTCTGYRDTTSIQIQDETNSVKQKVQRLKGKTQTHPPTKEHVASGLLSPESMNSDSSSDDTIDLDLAAASPPLLFPSDTTFGGVDMSVATLALLPIRPKPDDVATNYFFNQFTSGTHWQFLRGFSSTKMDPCLQLAINACGVAALDNVQNVVMGRDYARSMYAEALGLLNERLRDPKRCRTDASLIAVSMLGYYENLTCEGRASIQSWKSHIKGATQLLKLRGEAQFKTQVGRIMFREIRAQIMIQCLWDDLKPPEFLWELQPALEAYRDAKDIAKPVDVLTNLVLDFAVLRAKMRTRELCDSAAAQQASDLEGRFLQWQIDTSEYDERWRYYEIEVPDSEHVWDGKVHAYSCHPAPTAWNTWRNVCIMLSRTQEWLCRRFQFSESEREEQMQYFRRTRRQLTDDICATIPVQLGHSSPAYSSPCVLVTAYGSIWPLFFAGACAFERVGLTAQAMSNTEPRLAQTSAAAAQAMWILGRLDYISQNVGLKWAEGVAATLRGDFQVYENLLEEPNERDDMNDMVSANAPLIKAVEQAGRGAQVLIEKPTPVGAALASQRAAEKKVRGPAWQGHTVDRDEKFKLSKVPGPWTHFDALPP